MTLKIYDGANLSPFSKSNGFTLGGLFFVTYLIILSYHA